MNHLSTFVTSIILLLITAACAVEPPPQPAPSELPVKEIPSTAKMSPAQDSERNGRCHTPTPADKVYCEAQAAAILASTVRLELHRWLDEEGKRGEHITGGIGHGTVVNGRYIITHNHYGIPLASLEGAAGEHLRLTVYDANGVTLLESVQASTFSVAFQTEETIVLDFGTYVDQGLFEMLGIPSAPYQNWQALSLTPDAELAQINWDNNIAFVEWVSIQKLHVDGATPHLEVDNGLLKGASGGGLFLNGVHIGNNWSTTALVDGNNATVGSYSTAALNDALSLN